MAVSRGLIGLDTNVLLRVLVDESVWPTGDRAHARAARELVVGSREAFFVNHVVLVEAVWVLENPLEQPKAVLIDVVERLLASANVVLNEHEVVGAALEDFRKGHPGFADHLMGHLNRHAGCLTTMTFDKGARRSKLYTPLNSAR